MNEAEYTDLLRAVPRPMTAEWLRSPAYDTLMNRYTEGYDPDEAVKQTRSYVWRHANCGPVIGPWKWRGMQQHLGRILDAITGDKLVLDFGGACGPLGCDSVVVDVREVDGLGRGVTVRSLGGVLDGCVDAIVTSHTLEHVEDLPDVLAEMARVLRPGGQLIALVPSWKREIWRVGNLKSELWGDHVWDFGLEPSEPESVGLQRYANVASLIGGHLEVTSAEYCGDNNIIVFARRAA